MLHLIPSIAHSLRAVRTRAVAARHLGAPWPVVIRAAFGDAQDFADIAVPSTPAPGFRAPSPASTVVGGRGVQV